MAGLNGVVILIVWLVITRSAFVNVAFAPGKVNVPEPSTKTLQEPVNVPVVCMGAIILTPPPVVEVELVFNIIGYTAKIPGLLV